MVKSVTLKSCKFILLFCFRDKFVSSGLFICAGGILYDRSGTRLIHYVVLLSPALQGTWVELRNKNKYVTVINSLHLYENNSTLANYVVLGGLNLNNIIICRKYYETY